VAAHARYSCAQTQKTPGDAVALKITYQDSEVIVEEGSGVLIGSGEGSDIRIVRPGISRRHAAVAYDGASWKVEDVGSRNGTFADGERVYVTTIDLPTTLVFGHPSEGESIRFEPLAQPAAASQIVQDEIDAFVLPASPPAAAAPAMRQQRTPIVAAPPAALPPASPTSTDLTAAIRDQISAIKGLTWSVWAMIAVTAALCVLTLFVGVLGS
jgi:hypothetical protein